MFSFSFVFLFSPFSEDWESPQGDSRLQIPSQDSVFEEDPATPRASRALPEECNSIHFQCPESSWPWEVTRPSFTVNECHKWGQTVTVVVDGEIVWGASKDFTFPFLQEDEKQLGRKQCGLVIILHDGRETNPGRGQTYGSNWEGTKSQCHPFLLLSLQNRKNMLNIFF